MTKQTQTNSKNEEAIPNEAPQEQELTETPDLNLAVYIRAIKGQEIARHRKRGKTLLISFAISKDTMARYKEDYVNSEQALCDSVRRNFFHLLNEN